MIQRSPDLRRRAATRTFCLIFGSVYGMLGVAGVLLGTAGTPSMAGMPPDARLWALIPGTLEFGTSDHAIHVVTGAAFLIAGLMTPAPRRPRHFQRREAPFTP